MVCLDTVKYIIYFIFHGFIITMKPCFSVSIFFLYNDYRETVTANNFFLIASSIKTGNAQIVYFHSFNELIRINMIHRFRGNNSQAPPVYLCVHKDAI